MTPEQVRSIVEQVLAAGVGLHWSTYAGLAIVYLVGLIVAPLLTSYMSERGKNLATKQDVEAIVEQVQRVTAATEEIKTELAGGLWLRQKRWDLRREIYSQLLTSLDALLYALKDGDAVAAKLNERGPVQAEAQKTHDDARRRVDDAFNRVSSAKAVGQMLLIPEAVTALETLRDDWAAVIDAGETRGGLVRVAETALVKLREIARRDLLEDAPAK